MGKKATTLLCCFLSILMLNSQLFSVEKGYSNAKKNAFAKKTERHQVKPSEQKLQLFKQEIKELSARIKSHQQTLRLGSISQKWNEQLQKLETISGYTTNIKWSSKTEVPLFIKAERLLETGSFKADNPEKAAEQFFMQNNALLKIESPADEFKLIETTQDQYGMIHLRYQQIYQGLEVWGRDVRLHFNREGELSAFNGRYLPTPVYLRATEAELGKSAAIQIAAQEFGKQPRETNARQLISVDENERAALTWLVQIKKGLAENWHYFVDAKTGMILKSYNHVMTDGPVTGSSVDLMNVNRTLDVYEIGSDFVMIDASKQMFNAGGSTLPNDGKGVIYTLDARGADSTLFFVASNNVNNWTDPVSVSASANGGQLYDFFREKFNRNAIDGNGSTMNIIVNFKQNFNNAFWNGQYMVFGNGDGQAFGSLAGATDVTAHEMSLGVVERTANLVYENQPGALNESFADVFGVLFEFWLEGQNGDWLLGEDVTTPGIAGDALRNMENPAAANVAFGGQQPTKMSEFRQLANTPDQDHGGVHINSGIPNRAFYLFATNVAVGTDKAGAIYYHALTNYLTRNSQFIDCRLAVIKSAEDIHGAGSAEATAAAQAFDTVEIFDGNSTPPPSGNPPVVGDEFLAAISTEDGLLHRFRTETGEGNQVTTFSLFSRASVTDDGQSIFYVDQNNNVHLIGSDGSGDQQLTDSGGFSNVAVSPDGNLLAATSTFSEPVIYIFDITGTGQGVPFQLFNPTTAEGQSDANILFPDRLDWASDSNILMYDALNAEVNASGDTTSYWDINVLQASTGGIGRLLAPLPPGINIGNPVFASNTDNIIAFDFVAENGDISVLGENLNTNESAQIAFNFNSAGSPTFSNDDSKVYYHYIDQNGASLWVVDLLEDGITGAGNDQGLSNDFVFPVVFAIGQRPPTSVETDDLKPQTFTLAQNYPNPFNPETTIQYELTVDAEVSLKIFDVSGKFVATLENAAKQAGTYSAVWSGRNENGARVASGIYFYRLKIKATGKTSTLSRKMTLLK